MSSESIITREEAFKQMKHWETVWKQAISSETPALKLATEEDCRHILFCCLKGKSHFTKVCRDLHLDTSKTYTAPVPKKVRSFIISELKRMLLEKHHKEVVTHLLSFTNRKKRLGNLFSAIQDVLDISEQINTFLVPKEEAEEWENAYIAQKERCDALLSVCQLLERDSEDGIQALIDYHILDNLTLQEACEKVGVSYESMKKWRTRSKPKWDFYIAQAQAKKQNISPPVKRQSKVEDPPTNRHYLDGGVDGLILLDI